MPNQYSGHPRVTLSCATCGAPFVVKYYERTTSKFCSRRCQGAPTVKHGDARNGHHAPEYSIWSAMLDRCRNPNNPFYADYGGRGIRVCDEWRSYEAFLRDLGRRPSAGYSLDRADNNLGYAPGNVRWAPRAAQQRNKRDNARLTVGGVTRLRIEWSELTGVPHGTIRSRLRSGWSPERAVGLEA